MTTRTWVILGATSIIAEKFAHLAAQNGYNLLLVGRQKEQLQLIANDIALRYPITCETLIVDFSKKPEALLSFFEENTDELDLMLAQSAIIESNKDLTVVAIAQIIQVNIQTSVLCIDAYLKRTQQQHHLLFLSSVAACRGRTKNSLYGASKACIEVYLQGLQQQASQYQSISIARLGFIDTKRTFGLAKMFYVAAPEDCAKACWRALEKKKRFFYYPFFWRWIMAVIKHLPFFLYRKIGDV